MSLSRKPVRRGAIYCASACGHNCLYSEYQAAVKKSAALAKRLGPGWKPRVSENLGWWWSVDNAAKRLSVSLSGPRRGPHTFHCNFAGSYTGYGRTPELAIHAAVSEAIPYIPGFRQIIATVEEVTK